VYCAKGEKPEEDNGFNVPDESGLDAHEVSASRRTLAENAYRLLGAFDRLPGRNEDDTVDSDVLKQWVCKVLELGQDLNRRGPAEIHVGQVLAKAPSDADCTWPWTPVRDLLELLRNSNVESGLQTAVLNEEVPQRVPLMKVESRRRSSSRNTDVWQSRLPTGHRARR
jgi:hypothetical protein